MDKQILENDLKTLVTSLDPVKAKWKALGIALRMTAYDLDAIEANTRGSVERALLEMLAQWLKSDETRVWPHLIEALDNKSVRERRLAKKIRNEHCRDYVMESEGGGLGGSDNPERPKCDKRERKILMDILSDSDPLLFSLQVQRLFC